MNQPLCITINRHASDKVILLINLSNLYFFSYLSAFVPSRISYCTADKTQDKVFAYVSQSQFNETLECHAFLCQKRKIVSNTWATPVPTSVYMYRVVSKTSLKAKKPFKEHHWWWCLAPSCGSLNTLMNISDVNRIKFTFTIS